jgi:hypothetical protein
MRKRLECEEKKLVDVYEMKLPESESKRPPALCKPWSICKFNNLEEVMNHNSKFEREDSWRSLK